MKSAKENRDKVLHIRVTEEQHKQFSAYFKRKQTSISKGVIQSIQQSIQEAE
jgi:predicted HicB family RNase H-like nuclease